MHVSVSLVSRAPLLGLMKKGIFFDLRFSTMAGRPWGEESSSRAAARVLSM